MSSRADSGSLGISRQRHARLVRLRRNLTSVWCFLLPELVVYGLFLLYPAARSFWYSLTSWGGIGRPQFIGLRNYANALTDPATLHALLNNGIWSLVIIVVPTAIGLTAAVALNGSGKVRAFTQGALFLPSMLSVVAVGLVWDALFNPDSGFVDHLLQETKLVSSPVDWLGGGLAELAILIPGVWVSVGLPLVLYLAGLQHIPPERWEAARVDGASRLQVLRHVTIPGLRQATIVVVALATINSLAVFGLIYTMTGGGPGNTTQVLGTWVFFQAFEFGHVGYGSAVAWILTLLGFLVTVPYILWVTRSD